MGRRRAHQVSAEAACLVVLGSEPLTRPSLLNEAGAAGIAPADADRILTWLERHDYLVDADRPDVVRVAEFNSTWASAGWRAASQYHLQTYGYEFESYLPDGTSPEDAARMWKYAAATPDTDRGKSYGVQRASGHHVPSPNEVSPPQEPIGKVDLASLLGILSITGGVVRTAPLPWPGAKPALRKTSPSGGSRHPTELYVHVTAVNVGMSTGIGPTVLA